MSDSFNVSEVNAPQEPTAEIKVFLNKISESYLEQFPKGWINAEYRKVLGDPMIRIRAGIQPMEKLFNGYLDNDPADQIIVIHMPKDVSDFDNIVMETEGYRNSMRLKPTDKYHVYSSEKFGYRKAKGNTAKLLAHFNKYFIKCKAKVDQWRADEKIVHDID